MTPDEESSENHVSVTGRSGAAVTQLDAWRAVIGEKNSAYYLARFERLAQPGAGRLGWHWPAFFAAGGWLLYRKMWGWAIAYLLLPWLLLLGDGLFASASGRFEVSIGNIGLLAVAVYWLLPGMLANWLYLQHCNRLIRRTRRDLPRHAYLRRLSRRGGTSESAALAALVFSTLAAGGVAVGIGLAAYDDYGKRQRIVAALKIGVGARAAVGEFVDRHGTIPATLEATGFRSPALPPFIPRLTLEPRTGTIEITTQVSKAEIGAIYLVPEADEKERIVWTCHVDAVIEPFAPLSCRGAD